MEIKMDNKYSETLVELDRVGRLYESNLDGEAFWKTFSVLALKAIVYALLTIVWIIDAK